MSRNATVLHPQSLDEALELLADDPEETKLIAGGTAFTILWRSGLIQATRVISCTALPGLDRIDAAHDIVTVGALTTFRAAEVSGDIQHRLPVLASTLHHVANLRVRNSATWGGNIAEADNTSDIPALLVALDAEIVVQSTSGRRISRVRDLIVDFFETTLAPDEMIVELRIPTPDPGVGGSYVKFLSRSAEDRTCLGVAAFVDLASDGTCQQLRLAVIGAAPIPLRLTDVEAQVRGERLDPARTAEVADEYVRRADPMSDVRGSAHYRRHVLPALISDAISRAAAAENRAVLV